MQGGINIRTQHTHAIEILLGKNSRPCRRALTRLIIQVTGDDYQFMSAPL